MSKHVIDAARVHWSLDDASIKLIAARENQVYRVDGSTGPSALRLHRKGYRSCDEIRSELMWMDALSKQDILVPKPIPAMDGTTVKLIDGVAVDMLSWVEGTPLSKTEASVEVYYDLGSVLAKMHNGIDTWQPAKGFNRPTWDLIGDQPSWGRFWENPALTQEQQKLFLQFRDAAQTAIATMDNPDFGLIHADLVPDNVLIKQNQLLLIDFDDGGYGYRLFDLATITHRSRRTSGDGTLANAVIAGYSDKRSLALHALPLFEALRACTYVGWNISRIGETGGQERNVRFITEATTAVKKILI